MADVDNEVGEQFGLPGEDEFGFDADMTDGKVACLTLLHSPQSVN